MDWSDYEPIEGGNISVSGLGAMAKTKTKDDENELSKKHEKEAD